MQTVAVLIGMDYSHMRGALKGIAAYFADQPDWQLDVSAPNLAAVEQLATLKPAGVITHELPREWLDRPEFRKQPVCTLFERPSIDNIANVTCDDLALGRLAAEHLAECGFKKFGFVGPRDEASRLRCLGVCEALGCTTNDLFVFEGEETDAHASSHWRGPKWPDNMAAWLVKQPRPLGIVAASDIFALGVCQICHDHGLRVPEDVAVVGIGNDEMLTQVSHPLLSSVAGLWEAIGDAAARQLLSQIDDKNNAARQIVLPPIGVVPRGSSDVSATTDETVLAAGQYIRANFGSLSLNVEKVAKHVDIPRRSLERRFRQTIGRSILQEIRRVRVDRIKQMLAETDLPVDVISQRAGIRYTRYLATMFRQIVGQTPSEFREQFRPAVPA